MPRFPDAIGYLKELCEEVNQPWFAMLCDIAAVHGRATLVDGETTSLLQLFIGNGAYTSLTSSASPHSSSAASAVTHNALETLTAFCNFKGLSERLEVSLPKRISLIFGTNGSGKSSLCESLKVLSTAERPQKPLRNVRQASTTVPSFSYKFRGDAAPQTWSEQHGFGPRSSELKYFDATTAERNIKGAVEPGRVVQLAPFRLNVFSDVTALLEEFRRYLQERRGTNAASLRQACEVIRADFSGFQDSVLATLEEGRSYGFEEEMRKAEAFDGEAELASKRSTITEFEKASSEDGLRLLKAEHRELQSLATSVERFVTLVRTLWEVRPSAKSSLLASKLAVQQVLIESLSSPGASTEGLFSMLKAIAPVCDSDRVLHRECPLCRRELGDSEIALFKKYHELLTDKLAADISQLATELSNAAETMRSAKEVERSNWNSGVTLSAELGAAIMHDSDCALGGCTLEAEPNETERAALSRIEAALGKIRAALLQKKDALDVASSGREKLLDALRQARGAILPLEYVSLAAAKIPKLRHLKSSLSESAFWNARLPGFTQLLKRTTEIAKAAYEDLVVADFETRLDSEYLALAEKRMSTFGVTLARKGTVASVTVVPNICGNEIAGVLSEGEQQMHALALFFAESETSSHSVVIFDDPISSFDYNFIANFCDRLRNFAVAHPTRQLIVLTHNWEFFIQLQSCLRRSKLDGHLCVQVLENCSVVGEYTEKIDVLKTAITLQLSAPGEPSAAQKETLAANMRRLIEVIVNTHAFNGQRHQYKQKSHAISDFDACTKLVRLLPTEATLLRDLYSKLSISEHDDLRNCYVTTEKAMFQTRYDAVLGVERDLLQRK